MVLGGAPGGASSMPTVAMTVAAGATRRSRMEAPPPRAWLRRTTSPGTALLRGPKIWHPAGPAHVATPEVDTRSKRPENLGVLARPTASMALALMTVAGGN